MSETEDKSLPSAMDYPEHEKTYDLFILLFKAGTALVILILIAMAIFLL